MNLSRETMTIAKVKNIYMKRTVNFLNQSNEKIFFK